MSEDTISRKAVVDICNNAIDLWHGQLGEGIVIAVKKKIKELPPAQPETHEERTETHSCDCISRKVAIDAIEKNAYRHTYLDQIIDIIKALPSAQPERKTGRWIETEGLDEEIRCTMCTNPMRSDRGCDGSCRHDEKLYKQIMSIIKDRIDGGGA